MINDGESFVASFIVDLSTPDALIGDLSFGQYFLAVDSGTLEFSGGFVSQLDFAGSDVNIANDFEDSFDAVQVRMNDFVIQANEFSNLGTLASDALPTAGVAFDSAPLQSDSGNFQLEYADAFGTVIYAANNENNISFVSSAIPEPSSIAMLVMLGIAVNFRRKSR